MIPCATCGGPTGRACVSVTTLLEGWPPHVRRATWHRHCAKTDPLYRRARDAESDHLSSLCFDEVAARDPERVAVAPVPLPKPTPEGDRLRDVETWRPLSAKLIPYLRQQARRWEDLYRWSRRESVSDERLQNLMAYMSIERLVRFDHESARWVLREGEGR